MEINEDNPVIVFIDNKKLYPLVVMINNKSVYFKIKKIGDGIE